MSEHAMRRRPIRFGMIAVLALTLAVGMTPSAAQQARVGAQHVAANPTTGASGEAFRSSPVMFIENAGQWPEAARFQVWGGPAGTMWLAEDAIWITVVERSNENMMRSRVDPLERFDPQLANVERENVPRKAVNIKLSFVGANPHPRIEPFDRLDTVVSYFIGNEPEKWRSDVPVWGGVRYIDLYPGVDLELFEASGRVGSRIIWRDTTREVPANQLVRVEHANSVILIELANLNNDSFYDALSDALSPSPMSELNSVQNPNGTALVYSTFLGGNHDWSNENLDIAVDATGEAFVTGWTRSDFPTTPGSFQPVSPGAIDAFVAKLNPAGSALEYATFVGGISQDVGEGIALDSDGEAYLTGLTWSTDFPTTAGAFQRIHRGGTCMLVDELPCADVFVIKLAASGSAIVYSTLIGGAQYDVGKDIKVDATGVGYVVGYTYSWDFPVTEGAYQRSYKGGAGDAFIAKLTAAGNALVYSTFLGGSGYECNLGDDSVYPEPCALAIDSTGAAYVTGYTASLDFPTTASAFSRYESNAFVTKLKPDGSALVYSTYLNSTWANARSIFSRAIAVDQYGSAYVTGYTDSHLFPTTTGAFQTSIQGGTDAFITKFDPSGSGLVYSTFLGGSSSDEGYDIAVDTDGEAYVVGTTESSNFPTTADAFDGTLSNSRNDVFVVRLGAAGNNLGYATLLGGGSPPYGPSWAMAVAPGRIAFVTGSTTDASFPVGGRVNWTRSA